MSEGERYSTNRCAKVHQITISFGKEAKINKSYTHREQVNSFFLEIKFIGICEFLQMGSAMRRVFLKVDA